MENVILNELKSGNSINSQVLKLLPVATTTINSGDTCILTHFENADSIYVSKALELEKAQMIKDVTESTGLLFFKYIILFFFKNSFTYLLSIHY